MGKAKYHLRDQWLAREALAANLAVPSFSRVSALVAVLLGSA